MKAENIRNDAKDKKWQLGAVIPVMAADRIILTYAEATKDNVASKDATAFGIAYDHALSKRTGIYGGYSKVTNQAASTQGNFNPVSALPVGTIPTPAAGEDPSIWGFGIRHAF
jgi:predicted porin